MMSSDPYFPVPTIRRDATSLPPITRDVSMAILLLPCSATHRPNHLDAVAVLEPDGLELMAARDLAVHGDRGELALHAEGGEEALDAEAVRHLHHLAVDRALHRPSGGPKTKRPRPQSGCGRVDAVFPSLELPRSGSRGPGPHPVLRNPPPTTTIGVYHRRSSHDGHTSDVAGLPASGYDDARCASPARPRAMAAPSTGRQACCWAAASTPPRRWPSRG